MSLCFPCDGKSVFFLWGKLKRIIPVLKGWDCFPPRLRLAMTNKGNDTCLWSVIARRTQSDEAIAFMVLVLFILSFGGSLEGGQFTPSNKERGLCPRSNKGSVEGGIPTPSNIEHTPQYPIQSLQMRDSSLRSEWQSNFCSFSFFGGSLEGG